ncbi:MAG: hypothetical protein J1E64_04960 [Acetatifactor sp.]|nr:hypothetical protein [Acetatifactor sp.]
MKLKYISVATVASILLVLFLPVFLNVIFIGNNMNYNEKHKIVTLYNNVILLMFAVVGVGILFALFYLLRKIPFNRYTLTGVIIFSLFVCVLFYIINIKISKCIAFYGGWDCGMVANSARWVYEGGELGYDDYYLIYVNNVPITWILYQLYSISSELPNYPYNPEFIWIEFQCFMLTAAVFFSAMTVLIISKKVALTGMVVLINAMFLGLSPWKVIPYTDASTIAIPVFIIFLYTLFLHIKSRIRYILWLLMIIAGVLGGILKATCYVPLIAILLIELMWTLFGRVSIFQKIKKLIYRIVLFLCGFLFASYCKIGMYQSLDYEYNYDMAITWTTYLYDGLNELTTGSISGDGLVIVRAYAEHPRYIRDMVERKYIKDRLSEKGFTGLMDFWLRKQVMNYNDGTFSWFQEGFFNVLAYEDIIDSSWEEPLKDFYWNDGENFIVFNTLSQGIWIFVLLGVIVETIQILINAILCVKNRSDDTENDSTDICIRTVGIVTFIGIFLFVMLFEGRARYLFNSIAVFSTMAVVGYYNLANKLLCHKRVKKKD